MSLALPLYSSALLLTMLLSVVIAVVAYQRLQVPGSLAFLFGNVAVFFYALGSLFEITAATPDQALAALTVEYVGITTLGPLWFLTVVSATRGAWVVSPRRGILLFIVPVLLVVLVATNSTHHLFYTSLVLEHRGPFTVPVLGKGPFYMLNMVYMNVFLFLGTLTTALEARKAQGLQRRSLLILFTASFLPWSGMAIYQLGWSPWGLDTAPFGLTLSAVVFSIALFRYRLFDLMPLVLDHVFSAMKEGVMVVDDRGRLVGVNPALTAILPDLGPQQVGQELKNLSAAAPLLGTSPDLVLTIEGRRRVFQIDRSPLLDERKNHRGQILLLSDISLREELAARLARMARTDELTDLSNRRSFLERLRAETERHRRHGRTFSLAMADLDHFKQINDTWGHDAGDAALVHVARLWNSCLRSSDLLARYGGEEFTLLMADTAAPEALVLLERMRSLLEAEPLAWDGQRIPMTASFGVACTDDHEGAAPEVLIQQADQALYRAKQAGRNRIEGARR